MIMKYLHGCLKGELWNTKYEMLGTLEETNVFPSSQRTKWNQTPGKMKLSFNHLDARESVSIVAKDDFVFFIGGAERLRVRRGHAVILESTMRYTDVYRYTNLCKNQWNQAADFLQPKMEPGWTYL